ncbi:hypothetical protein MWU49_09195 [Alcanivorax sp. S6407]|uniref:hypothetical protein n=1 Tax=Alcanivorax sp. S6407 TaxID=2926424 RepID=UPI001FF33424|nr:hypothetical protein [Alcanivorax sp. S6407]MCK0153878.1 hypothetical protein [Alcanivorax sp. S6407]
MGGIWELPFLRLRKGQKKAAASTMLRLSSPQTTTHKRGSHHKKWRQNKVMKPKEWIKTRWENLKNKYWDTKPRYDAEMISMGEDVPWLRQQWERLQKANNGNWPLNAAKWTLLLIAGGLLLKALGI